MEKIISQKWILATKVIPFVLFILFLKFIIHFLGFEFLSLNSLFTAVISANIFLIGFLISGVLTDYKEAEKLPGELAISLEVIHDECQIIYKNKNLPIGKECLIHIKELNEQIISWFHKKTKTKELFEKIKILNDYFFIFESFTQANFIVRLKTEQSNIRRTITRIHTIRETSFNSFGYAITEIITFILCLGLIFMKIDPFYESIFFVTFVSFILIYMIILIKDLDNPFGYYEKEELSQEVSLKPIFDLNKRL